MSDTKTNRCPVMHGSHTDTSGDAMQRWFPDRLNLDMLRRNTAASDPLDPDFDYAEAFAELDVEALRADVDALMTDSQDWWPADYGHYGPFFIRLSWHAAGTYRTQDGRGGAGSGMQRFSPLNSWDDNGNLDKARRLLWPIKQKYGQKISWSDLIVFVGDRAIATMGLPTFGFAFGRADAWEPEKDTYWGPETEWRARERYDDNDDLELPLGASEMGLIYVNPEGPEGIPDPARAAKHIRQTFSRMAMNDEETVALVAGGHTFGKSHGAAGGAKKGPIPESAGLEAQGMGWISEQGSGSGPDTHTSGIEGAWTKTPIQWDMNYFENLFGYDWELTKSPTGAHQWTPKDPAADGTVPDAHRPDVTHAPMMHTTDLALKVDPEYRRISQHYFNNPLEFEDAFKRAWFKLLHRDMGPKSRYLGPWVPEEDLLWQDPLPPADHPLIDDDDIAALKRQVLDTDLSIGQLVNAAWASASTFRNTDKRGGANGARVRLAPQKGWEVNASSGVQSVIERLESIQTRFNAAQSDGKRVSLADLIVLGGVAAVEAAADKAGHRLSVAFEPGRTDATDEQTEAESFEPLEPSADAFRNYRKSGNPVDAEQLMVDHAARLSLTPPEMTVLVGGMRVLGANAADSEHGVFTDRKGTLSNDFFRNLLDMKTEWKATSKNTFEGNDRRTGEPRWTATRMDLIFGSNSELRALAEVYGSADGESRFVQSFGKAFGKVMHLDRFDL